MEQTQETITVVDKRKYDLLLRKYFLILKKTDNLQKLVNELHTRTTQFDDRVLGDLHQFNTLEEERAYLGGAYNATKAIQLDIYELGGKYDVEISKQQNQV